MADGLLLNSNLTNDLFFFFFLGVKGLNANQPGHSCKDIRDSGDSKGDGEYWIDPEKSGNPFKVFCDMTTKGGKFRQEIIEVRERLPHVSLKPKLIPHKLFLVIVPSSSAYTLRALRGCFHGEFVMCRFV